MTQDEQRRLPTKQDVAQIFCHTMGETLSDRELLELLLLYTDCAERATALADEFYQRFGSYSAIFKAKYTELKKIPGITERTVTLLIAIGSIYRTLLRKSSDYIGRYIDDVGQLFFSMLEGASREELWIAGFDDRGVLRACDCLACGTQDSVLVDLMQIADYASVHHVNQVALAHNHPVASQLPGYGADENAAFQIGSALAEFNIFLREYVVIDHEIHVFSYIEND